MYLKFSKNIVSVIHISVVDGKQKKTNSAMMIGTRVP